MTFVERFGHKPGCANPSTCSCEQEAQEVMGTYSQYFGNWVDRLIVERVRAELAKGRLEPFTSADS